MQRNAYLTFSIDSHTRKITSCARYADAVGTELSEFLSGYVSPASLNDPDVKFDYPALEEFILRKGEDRTMTISSRPDGRRYRFVAYPSRSDKKSVYCSVFVEFDDGKSDPYIYDYLTGVYTCSYAVAEIEKRISAAAKGTLFFIDVDNFKKINDTLGRTAGDECLRRVSANLKDAADGALVGRYGGDEFIIWVENKSAEELKEIAKKFLSVRYAALDGISDKTITVTCCVGASSFPDDATNFLKLFYKADKALTKAKKLGKNNAAFFGEEPSAHSGNEPSDGKKQRKKNDKLFEGELRDIKFRAAALICVAIVIISVAMVFVAVYYSARHVVPLYAFIILLGVLLAVMITGTIFLARFSLKNMKLRYIDPVTGGINQARLVADAGKLIKNGRYAVVSLNIVHFKYVNEQLGRDMANSILFNIYKDVDGALRDGELVARGYADRFTAIMKADDHLKERIAGLQSSLARAKYAGRNITLKFTVGVYVFPDEPDKKRSPDLALGFDRASFALMQADETDESVVYFNDNMLFKEMEVGELEQRGEQALRDGNFVVYYQMKRDILKDSWCGAEALVRWIDPVEGIISPGKFVPVFERNGFIVELDKYVFYEVCRDIRVDLDGGKEVLPISVNVSRKHFADDNFLEGYVDIIKRFKIPSNLIEFELTESIVMESEAKLKKFIRRVHDIGCKCSIDDFGSGYSSLNMLKEFDFDIVKFDRGFFYGADGFDANSQTIVFSLIKLSHDLGMKVVSEGIEQETQRDFLLAHKCDIVQGYLYSKPMPHCDYIKYLKDSAKINEGA